ncbi:MAG: TRAP transporter large permease [Desulfobacteraceae bacterium]|nr:TRAP transporter large permease [Desulfobacteraceae bacterium]
MILAILLIGLFFAMAIGVPVAWALGISGLGAILFMDVPLNVVPQKIYTGIDIFVLMCVPFFILAGEIMRVGITKRLLDFAVLVVGGIRGGLSLANVIASMVFGGITGSAIADSSALGSVEIPMMTKNGYDAPFSAAITGASACIGPIIPPSIPVVIYSMAVGGVSIGALFAAGMIPGILVGVALMIACFVISRRRNYPKRAQKVTAREFLRGLRDASLAIMTPVIILGGIIGGIFSPTEAATVAVIYSFIISYFVFRELRLSDLPQMFVRSAVTSSIVLIIIATSNVFGLVIAFEQVALKLATILEPMGYVGFLLTVNIMFLVIGTFLDNNPAILILAPIFAPIAVAVGVDPIHFGIIVIMNLMIGLITPPLGEVLFVVAPLAKVSFEDVAKAVTPFTLVEIGVLLLVTYVPVISLWIPRLLGYVQ